MFILVCFIIFFIIVVSLILTLDKTSKIRKFLIIFISIFLSITLLIVITVIYREYSDKQKNIIEHERILKQNEIIKANNKLLSDKLEYDKKIALTQLNYSFNYFTPIQSPFIINLQQNIHIVGRLINNSNLKLDNFVIGYIIEDCNSNKCITVKQGTNTITDELLSNQAKDTVFNIGSESDIIIYGTLKISASIIAINIDQHEIFKNKNKECIPKAFCVSLPE